MKHAKIVAACDQREAAAMKTAKRWGIPSAYQDFGQMLESEKLDFVDICTPPATHSLLSLQAMEAGLHVLVEKPMAERLSQADEMVSASRKHRVKLCMVHNYLFTPVVEAAKSLVHRGAIGDLVAMDIDIRATREYLGQQSHWSHYLPGGVFAQYAPHAVYLALAFLGKIRSVRAISGKSSPFAWVAADELKVLVEGEKGVGAFGISCNSPRYSFNLDLVGTKEKLHLDTVAQTITHIRSRTNRTHGLVLDRLDLALQLLAGAISISVRSLLRQKWYKLGHRAVIQKFVESIRNDLDPPATGENGRETMRVLEEVWKQLASPKD
jgi:predicted dehydrogenase